MVELVKKLENTDSFAEFTRVRRKFEDFLLSTSTFTNQITQKFGSGLKGYLKVVELYGLLLEQLQAGAEVDDLVKAIAADRSFAYLQLVTDEEDETTRKNFSSDAKWPPI